MKALPQPGCFSFTLTELRAGSRLARLRATRRSRARFSGLWIFAISALVRVHDVEHPMQAVFDAPMMDDNVMKASAAKGALRR